MKFICGACGGYLEADGSLAGMQVACPECSAGICVPPSIGDQGSAAEAVASAIHSTGDFGGRSIVSLLKERGIEGGVQLGESLSSENLFRDSDQRYKVGDLVAKGGMGAILRAEDVNLRRRIAMKVIKDPDRASDEEIVRFIEEAQIAGQLEHPGIVPVYELGLDREGQVFYTMKLLGGKTLGQIIREIREGTQEVISQWPLNRLLNVFIRICEALDFAHAHGVVHRDLKPDNVMVGDFGEVQVLDWGLAKLLNRAEADVSIEEVGFGTIRSLRSEEGSELLMSLDGAVMGTPQYMAPEQADGRISEIDARTDVYALGAILYEILTLRPAFHAGDIYELLERVRDGSVRPPSDLQVRSAARTTALPHCPAGRIPDALSLITMKALSTRMGDRYPSVRELMREIEAWQGGFAVEVENAGFVRRLRLFTRRNKTVTAAAFVIFLLTFAAAVINFVQRNEAIFQRERADDTLVALKGTTPALEVQANTYFREGNYSKALETITYACELAPSEAKYKLRRGHILQVLVRLEEAKAMYTEVLALNPNSELASENIELCEMLEFQLDQSGEIAPLVFIDLWRSIRDQGRIQDAMALVSRISGEKDILRSLWKEELESRGLVVEGVIPGANGELENLKVKGRSLENLEALRGLRVRRLTLSGFPFLSDISALEGMFLEQLSVTTAGRLNDLSPLLGMPLKSLEMLGCPAVTDLSPLRESQLTNLRIVGSPVSDLSPLEGLPLTRLRISGSQVSDLSPLQGMALEHIDIEGAPISDLSPLKGMPCKSVQISGTRISDLSPLSGLQLHDLYMSRSRVSDLSPLKGMPLKRLGFANTDVSDVSVVREMSLTYLAMANCPIEDITPLANVPLIRLVWTPHTVKKGIGVIRNIPTLEEIGRTKWDFMPTEEYWKRYDAGEFRE